MRQAFQGARAATALALVVVALILVPAECCSYSVQRDQFGRPVATRSMEFSQGLFSDSKLDVISNFSYYPANSYELPALVGNASAPNPTAQNLTNKYAFAQIDQRVLPMVGSVDHGISSDGMNEKGLTISALVLLTSQYEKPGLKRTSITYLDFVSWVLGNMGSIKELKKALATTAITSCAQAYWSPGEHEMCAKLPQGLHWAIEDAKGESVVLEFTNGAPKFYNNSVGTLTNDPAFPFMKQNLMQYQTLTFSHPNPEMAEYMRGDGVPVVQSSGFNQFGIPGDGSPISRFAKLYVNRAMSTRNGKPQTLEQVMVQQQAIINSVFLPFGAASENGRGFFDYTVFNTMKIPSTCTFAYRTYKDMTWKYVDVCGDQWKNVTAPVHRSLLPENDTNPLGMVDVAADMLAVV